jgi:hypothetical protein
VALVGNASASANDWKTLLAFAVALCGPVLVIGRNIATAPWSLAILVFIAAAPSAFLLSPRLRAFLTSLAISAAVVLVAIAPTSRLALGNYWKGDDLPVLTAAKELAAILPRYQQKHAPLVFWYDDKDGSNLRMLQSFYLHEFTKWKDAQGANVPFLSTENAEPPHWHGGAGDLVVLAQSPDERKAALDRLQGSPRQPESVKTFQIPAAAPIAYGALVSYAEPHFKETTSLLDRLEYHRKAKVSASNRLEFTTSSRKWNRDVIVPLPASANGDVLHVVLQVSRGAFFVDIEDAENSPGPQPYFLSESDGPVSIFLEPTASASSKNLRIRNAAPHGVRSKARIQEICLGKSSRRF